MSTAFILLLVVMCTSMILSDLHFYHSSKIFDVNNYTWYKYSKLTWCDNVSLLQCTNDVFFHYILVLFIL
jgi:hypothetical protein